MDPSLFLAGLTPAHFGAAALVAALAGLVKGAVGFAMPMIMISGLASFLAADLALAALILPTLLANGIQALRQGLGAALSSIRRYGVFLIVGAVCLLASAQLVRVITPAMLFLSIGVPIVLFAALQLSGWRLIIPPGRERLFEGGVGAVAGLVGGLSGVWGPPTVSYLTALNTPKEEQFRIQGVIYGLGAVLLFLAHMRSGVLRAETLPLSFAMVPPAMLGMWAGLYLHDRMDQRRFQRLTLVVLIIAGLNLIRRALVA